METRKINYKSDFDFILYLKDCKDKEKTVPFPECDFDVRFWTSVKANAYTASYKSGTYTNCLRTEDGGMHFVFDSHHLGAGTLKWEPHFEFPNGLYPDSTQDIFSKESLGIELVDGPGECPTTAEVEVMLPYIKGDPFTWEDFTPEQIKELQRPAMEAADSVKDLEKSIETAEYDRNIAERNRKDEERARVNQESIRQTQEAFRENRERNREKAEEARQTNEEDREAAEDERVSAENARAEEFATWEAEIDSKADKSELSNVLAEEPLTPGNFPDVNTYTREQLKMDLFIDMWNERCKFNGIDHYFGKYNRESGLFELNEITDITYEEALQIWAMSPIKQIDAEPHKYMLGGWGHTNSSNYILCRTYFPICHLSYKGQDLRYFFASNVIVETLNFVGGYGISLANFPNLESTFNGCRKLRKILCDVGFPQLSLNTFKECEELEYINLRLYIENNTLVLKDSPKISYESLHLLITNARFKGEEESATLTVTVHPDVYAKLTDETNTEWHALLAQAAEKNINFATV